ncbi:MAG: SMC family ATPase [Armatimonadota bacterium]|nr:SMC family ATPase [Armatimonadota bacterium]
MIPLRLQLKNFLSYGDDVPALDFAGMHTLCLSGENGHGKSALLDAMTWALWGESRAGKNKHDDLVRLGADEMSVEFTFEMDGLVYRVLRKRSKRAAGNQWELQQASGDDTWRSLSGNTSGETEKAIQKLLRMSYDTFSNAAYLRQGQADQFVQQTPGKRKEILADILDLSRYDQLEAKARDRAKEAGADAAELERDLNGIDAELQAEESHQTALAEAKQRLEDLQAQQKTLRAEWEALKERKGQLDNQKQFADRLRQEIGKLDVEIIDIRAELAAQQAESDRWNALLARQDEICRDFEGLQETRQQLEDLERSLTQFHKGQQMLAAAEKEWMAAQNEVQNRMTQAVRNHQEAVARLADLPTLQKEHDALVRRVADADARERERQSAQQALQAVQEQFGDLREENARLDLQIGQWQERLEALSQQQETCRVCNAPLPPAKIESTRAEYEEALADLQARRKEVRADAGRLKAEIAEGERQVKTLEAEVKAATQHRIRLGQLEQRLLELEVIEKDLPALAANREQANRLLQDGQFAPEVRARVEKYTSLLQKLGGVEADHAAARGRLSALVGVERLHLELGHAQTALSAAQAQAARAQKSLGQREASQREAQSQLADLADVSAELAELDRRGAEIRALEPERQRAQELASQEIGRHEHALARCADLKTTRAEKSTRLSAAKKDKEVHEQLAAAFGKKGVQALIIENAIPELQEEANRLLERLTDGDMTLHFDTLRAAKTKRDSPIETLDIKVSDNLGTRPLEMYSGGEGFRAAFALRIALSKLLARRAGARLQTLIIDEGFGTQDGKGREKMVDALNAIKDDFERVIVITHIDELKDAFATRVEITKTPSGSQITVLEGAAG